MGIRKALGGTICSLLKSEPKGLGFNELFSKMESGASYDTTAKNKTTLSNALKRLLKEGYIDRDVDTRKYKLSDDGKKYLQRSEIVDWILSSGLLDSYSEWTYWKRMPEEIAAVYVLLEAKKDATPKAFSVPMKRTHRLKAMSWDDDFLDFALMDGSLNKTDAEILSKMFKGEASFSDMNALERKIKEVWEKLFRGVERVTIVETVNCKLLFEKITHNLELLRSGKSK